MKRVRIINRSYEVFSSGDRQAAISRSPEGRFIPEKKWKILLFNQDLEQKPQIIRGFSTKKAAKKKLRSIF